MQGQTTGQGPCASLFHNPHKLAWSCLQDDIWADHNGHQVDIVTPRVELEDRLQQAWHFRVMAILEDMRKTMKGATRVDVALTRECYEALPNDHRGLMKCALNGAQFTNDALAHANLTADATCRFVTTVTHQSTAIGFASFSVTSVASSPCWTPWNTQRMHVCLIIVGCRYPLTGICTCVIWTTCRTSLQSSSSPVRSNPCSFMTFS